MESDPKFTMIVPKGMSQSGEIRLWSDDEGWNFSCVYAHRAEVWPPRVRKMSLNARFETINASADLRLQRMGEKERGRVEIWLDDMRTHHARVRMVKRDDDALVLTVYVDPR